MELIIQTPEGMVYSGEAESVHLPGEDGSFQILNNHAPLIAALRDGVVRVETAGAKQVFNIKSGIVEVLKNKISVLTEGVA
jgi:F-type H+-transporting ATPase subunit epsilon